MSSLLARRALAFVFCGLFFLVATVLLLADRSGVIVGAAYEAVIETGQQIERTWNIDVVDRQDIPGTVDQIGHAVLWGSGMALVGWVGRHRLSILVTAVLMAAASIVFELSQPVLSTTRAFQRSDVVGNIAGIVGAAILLAVALGIQRLRTGYGRIAARTT